MSAREHTERFDCWCNPRLYEVCDECGPFDGFLNDVQRNEAIYSALAVQFPVHGITAARPKKSKNCWKCGGDGVKKVPDDARHEQTGPPWLVLHRQEPQIVMAP